MTAISPYSYAATTKLLAARSALHPAVRTNGIIPIIIAVAIVVLLALGATIVIGAIALCAQHGGVLDGYVNISAWTVKVTCHKL